MANCPKCNGQISDTAKFCKHCGNKIEQKAAFVFCEECGAKIESNAPFCEECGAKTAVSKDDPWANNDPWATFADYKQPAEKIVEKVVEKPQPEENEIEKYNEKLSKKELDKLEGTDDRLYYVHKRDKRTEKQLHDDFAKYFDSKLFRDYKISTNVDPREFIYASHAKYCKPVNFVFTLGNRDVLAVNIARYNVAKHPVVYYVKDACKRRGVKHINFIVGYPNKEHYVVRRVLEELGEIPYLYGKK